MGVSSFFIPYNVLREMGSLMMLLKMISMTSNVFLFRARTAVRALVIVCADCRFFYKKG